MAIDKAQTLKRAQLGGNLESDAASAVDSIESGSDYDFDQNITTLSRAPSVVSEEEWADEGSVEEVARSIGKKSPFIDDHK